jgi:hypothetical protein
MMMAMSNRMCRMICLTGTSDGGQDLAHDGACGVLPNASIHQLGVLQNTLNVPMSDFVGSLGVPFWA